MGAICHLTRPEHFRVTFRSVRLFKRGTVIHPARLSVYGTSVHCCLNAESPGILTRGLPVTLVRRNVNGIIFSPANAFGDNSEIIVIPGTPYRGSSCVTRGCLGASGFYNSSVSKFLRRCIRVSPGELIPLPRNVGLGITTFARVISISIRTVAHFGGVTRTHHRHVNI